MKKQRFVQHVHKDVAEVAKEAANELYDYLMRDNLIYETWRRQHPGASPKALRAAFVNKVWPKAVPFARATMARLLATSHDPQLTERIYQALILDNQLILGRGRSQGLIPELKNAN
jgi:hypothetical protein